MALNRSGCTVLNRMWEKVVAELRRMEVGLVRGHVLDEPDCSDG